MAKELTKEEIESSRRFVGTSDEFEFVGIEEEVEVTEIKE